MRAALPFLFLAACAADLPPIEGSISEAARTAPPPVLVPAAPILAARDAPSRAAAAGIALDARAGGLRAEAREIPAPEGPGAGGLDARADALRRGGDLPSLEARASALRARAEALRAAPL